ncbi:MAG: type I phosphomannose isomerase catalytic subunit [Phycisphaerales bacterium]
MTPSPLVLAPILKEKVWGGRALERVGKLLPPGKNIGESWELADLASTSADGGGGDAAHSEIAHGPMRGMTIADAVRAMGANLLGRVALTPTGGFPLLVKFLDARENLSVQVHPSPVYAAANPGAHLKTESWYILGAEPGAVIYKGVKPGVTREAFAAHIADGTVVNDLIAVPAIPGELHHLPSGTCHALGAGVLVAEVQTPSDTTFRVFDWGRTGRTLHVAQALECIRFGPPEKLAGERAGPGERTLLVSTPFYALAELRLAPNTPHTIRVGGAAPRVWMVLEGEGELCAEAGEFAPLHLRAGETTLFPAAMPAARFTTSGASAAKVLEVLLPH